MRGFRQFFITYVTKCHACHATCTLSPLDTALTMRFAKNTQHDTTEVPASRNGIHLLKTSQKYRACHTRCLTCHETCWNVTKCHAFHTKRHCATFEPPKVTTFAALPIEHAVTSTVAIGCEHKSSVERTRLNPKGCIQEKVSVKKKFMAIEI